MTDSDEQPVRERVLARLGKFPSDCPLDAEVVDEKRADGFVRKRVRYDVEPDERISAYLLIPSDLSGGEHRPGVLAIHQHGSEFYVGKSEPAGRNNREMSHYGAELCRRGYVVLCPDLVCFEERQPPEFKRCEGTAPSGWDCEKFVAMDLLLQGSTLQAKHLSDLAVGVEYLATLPFVDSDRLGTIGHSLGGQEAAWLAWYDDRIRAAVSSCGLSLYRAIQAAKIHIHNYAMYVPDLLAVGDVDRVLADAVPTTLFVTHGTDDHLFPVDACEELDARVASAYEDAGYPDRFRARVFDGEHAFPERVREESYAWLDEWLRT